MSVFDDPEQMPKHRKPAWLSGGEGRDPLFRIEATSLADRASAVPVGLAVRYDGMRAHAVVEPAAACSYAALMTALCLTRAFWVEVSCPPQ